MSNKTALLLLAEGAEEMETVITADVLRRAEIRVTIASLTDEKIVKCSRDVKICADETLNNVKDKNFDVIILPGGLGGSERLAANEEVGKLLKKQEAEGRIIAAICAAPCALLAHDIAKGKKITSYPSMKPKLQSSYKYVDEDVVVIDGNLITSKGPGTTIDFALAIVEKLIDNAKAGVISKALLYNRS